MSLIADPVIRGGAGERHAAGAGAGAAGPAPAPLGRPGIDLLITHHPRLPRDRTGRRLHGSGRALIVAALDTLYRAPVTGAGLVRDAHKRWSLPEYGLSVSVAHCDAYSAVAFAAGPHVGVDLQDERDRPHAMRWLGTLLGREQPAALRDFAECEALIKASHLAKETFAGTRLPDWRPGWRTTNVPAYQVSSTHLGALPAPAALRAAPGGTPAPVLHLALAADAAADVRRWWQPGPGEPVLRLGAPTPEPV
ncbi:hypothetical protein [Streptomyces sp. NPDC058657]|uniref:hypothetical protein n=1 Tax=unclassified Streptomyces TaxID=2593676 RepID=UPI0036529EEC